MKLVRITHYRCSEYAGYTYVFAPDEWSEDAIDEHVSEAKEAYLESMEVALSKKPPHVPLHPKYEDYPNETVAEVRGRHEAEYAAYREAEKARTKAMRPFESFLKDQGFVRLADSEDIIESEVDWGHRHGQPIDYSETETDMFPSPSRMAKALVVAEEEDV